MELRKAIVIDNNDPDKKGKVQLRILPEMKDVDEDKLPWCFPFMPSHGGGENPVSEIPENDDMVTAFIKDPSWIYIEYMAADYIEDKYPYADFEDIVGDMTELGTQTYPNPQLRKYKDGSFSFHNTATGEHGFYNKNGSYCLFDVNGDVYVYSKDKVKIYDDHGNMIKTTSSGLEIEDKSGNTIVMSSTGVNINSGNFTVDL